MPLLFNTVLEILTRAIRQGKKKKEEKKEGKKTELLGNRIRKEEKKLALCMIFYVQNPKESISTKKPIRGNK